MNIAPLTIDQDGPGIDLTNQADGVSIQMSDPVTDFEYARNAVTLTFHLVGALNLRLQFEAMEFGDEPHAPSASPFGDSENFDGVAVSGDGVDWYEIQDLRGLRSDKLTAYDLDLDAIVSGLGLSYGPAFRIRFCQYDNNPAPKDGIFLQGITLEGDAGPMLHLSLDDNAATPVVLDSAGGAQHQTFLDPGGDANTDAHSVAGVVGTALSFDGVDDQIDLGTAVDGALGADQDFAIAFWWARGAGNEETGKHIFFSGSNNGRIFAYNNKSGSVYTQFNIYRALSPEDRLQLSLFGIGYDWNHYVLQRSGDTFELWLNGVMDQSDVNAANTREFTSTSGFMLGGSASNKAQGSLDDFRVYNRTLYASEITALATP